MRLPRPLRSSSFPRPLGCVLLAALMTRHCPCHLSDNWAVVVSRRGRCTLAQHAAWLIGGGAGTAACALYFYAPRACLPFRASTWISSGSSCAWYAAGGPTFFCFVVLCRVSLLCSCVWGGRVGVVVVNSSMLVWARSWWTVCRTVS